MFNLIYGKYGKYGYYILFLILVSLVSCAKPQGSTPQEKRAFVNQMMKDTLAELYQKKPETRPLVKNTYGYGVFSNINTQLMFFGTGNGYGVAVDNGNGNKIYMNMAEGGVGLGIAFKDFREVIIFNNKDVFYKFITSGWNMAAQGDAAAKYKEEGGATTGEVPLDSDILVYQLTESGLALRANFGASKFWIDKELN